MLAQVSSTEQLPPHVPGQDNERLLIQLDEAGIMAAAGLGLQR